MTSQLFLVRHAHAGSRSSWPGEDVDRPLDDKGHAQAEHVASLLNELPIDKVLSSPAVRCIETVQPLADKLGLTVKVMPAFFEGSDVGQAIDLLRHHAHRHPVVCSHGDLIPEIIRVLVQGGMRIKGERGNQKGSVWTLDFDGERFTKATYTPPG